MVKLSAKRHRGSDFECNMCRLKFPKQISRTGKNWRLLSLVPSQQTAQCKFQRYKWFDNMFSHFSQCAPHAHNCEFILCVLCTHAGNRTIIRTWTMHWNARNLYLFKTWACYLSWVLYMDYFCLHCTDIDQAKLESWRHRSRWWKKRFSKANDAILKPAVSWNSNSVAKRIFFYGNTV